MRNSVENIEHMTLAITSPKQTTQDFLNKINETTYQTVNNLTDITHKSINGFTESVEQANHTLDTLTDQAKQSISQNFSDTTNNLSQITNSTVGAFSEKAKQAGDSLSITGKTFVGSVENNFQKVEQFSNAISTEIERGINSLINNQIDNIKHWIDSHIVISWILRFLNWVINHPVIGLITIMLILFSIWQLFKIFSRLIEKCLLATLTTPFKLIVQILKLSFKPVNILASDAQELAKSEGQHDRLSQLLSRLDNIKREQSDILQEISTIVSTNK